MKIAYYIKKSSLKGNRRIDSMLEALDRGGATLYPVRDAGDMVPSADVLLSIGGDGTFLTAARLAERNGTPVLGVNFGRMGFLSENQPEDIAEALLSGKFSTEERRLLKVTLRGASIENLPLALNEISVSRGSAAMLGVDVEIDGAKLPTYWADGLLVATSSGSTAYSLSVGGPICAPQAKVFIVAPVAPHNLNVRPLVIPESSNVEISLRSRNCDAVFTVDNCNYVVPSGVGINVRAADTSLKIIRLGGSNFVNALSSRLLWGQDVRNLNEI